MIAVVMPHYRRAHSPGGTFFLTLVTEARAPIFRDAGARAILHRAFASARERRPFTIDAIVLLPDHLHVLLTLPPEDGDFSTRIASVKAAFTHDYLALGGSEQPLTEARRAQRRRGVWQRWFWEHRIRDQDDLLRHLDYIHYNPVKHGLCPCPHLWECSSFHRHVELGTYAADWACRCDGRAIVPPAEQGLPIEHME